MVPRTVNRTIVSPGSIAEIQSQHSKGRKKESDQNSQVISFIRKSIQSIYRLSNYCYGEGTDKHAEGLLLTSSKATEIKGINLRIVEHVNEHRRSSIYRSASEIEYIINFIRAKILELNYR